MHRRPSRSTGNAQISLAFRWISGCFGLSSAASAACKSRYRAGFEQWDRAASHDCRCALQGRLPAMARLSITGALRVPDRSEEHTSELQSLMRISYAVFCLKKKTNSKEIHKVYCDKLVTTHNKYKT